MANEIKRSAGRRVRGAATFLLLFGAWWGVSRLELARPEYLPSPGEVWSAFVGLVASGDLPRNAGASLARIGKGFSIGASIGFLLGASMGLSRPAERAVAPIFNALRQVPLLGWAPLIVLWCGVADSSKVIFIAIGAVIPMVLNTFEGVRSTSQSHVEVGRVFECGTLKLLHKVILPSAVPKILSGLRLSLGTSWMLLVWAEVSTRSARGLGDMLWSAKEGMKLDVVIVSVAAIALVASLTNQALGLLESRLLHWRQAAR